MTKEEVRKILDDNNLVILEEKRSGNDLGTVFKLNSGCIVNCWDTGKVNCQGKNKADVEQLFNNSNVNKKRPNKEVFVVYGHDNAARTQLEAMLRRWELKPLIMEQLVSSGQTIIEKLEEYTNKASFGIVLATPDDIGYPKNDETKKQFRVRQNVVLELGMLLSKIGRERIAILLSQAEDMEKPSDIDGLIYIPFKNNVEETKVSLAKEMNNNGYSLNISQL